MIKEFLDKVSIAYYAGTPFISDEEFDSLAAQHNYTQLGSPEQAKYKHIYKLYSLQKYYPGEEPPQYRNSITTPKLDGAAIAITYVAGVLIRIATRGDGIVGHDITEKLRHLVPQSFITPNPIVQIVAEVVAPRSIPNARNYAAGALNLKDIAEIKTRDLHIFAYDVRGIDLPEYTDTLEWLVNTGFNTVSQAGPEFPTDGVVVRENSNKLFQEAGYTAKHPRGAYALKVNPDTVVTTLLDVEWQLGRTGVVSPVAILEPVLVGDATVSRATLHNIDYINALDLEIGCKVEVVRAGEIIPRIIRRVV
jgi:DNA ligase (NAD+)